MLAVTNDVYEELGLHYVTIFVQCERDNAGQEPVVGRNPSVSQAPVSMMDADKKCLLEPRTKQMRRLGLEELVRDQGYPEGGAFPSDFQPDPRERALRRLDAEAIGGTGPGTG